MSWYYYGIYLHPLGWLTRGLTLIGILKTPCRRALSRSALAPFPLVSSRVRHRAPGLRDSAARPRQAPRGRAAGTSKCLERAKVVTGVETPTVSVSELMESDLRCSELLHGLIAILLSPLRIGLLIVFEKQN